MSESPPTDNSIDLELEKLKIDSESKSVEFSDLTVDVLKVIIEQSQLKERLILRKVSRDLRALVDDQKWIFTDIGFEFDKDHIRVEFNGNHLVYTDPNFDVREIRKDSCYPDAKVIRSKDYLTVALDDLKFAIHDPTLELNALRVEFSVSCGVHRKQFSEEIETILKSLNHQIRTKSFATRPESVDQILAVLPYLEPRTLQCIEFRQCRSSWRISDAEFERIAVLDQWKQAKQLNLRYANSMWWQWKHLMHFEEFYILSCHLDLMDVCQWRDFFSKSKHSINCQMRTANGFSPLQIQNHVGDGVPTLMSEQISNPMYIVEHPIRDDPNQYLEIAVWSLAYCIVFKKVARQSPLIRRAFKTFSRQKMPIFLFKTFPSCQQFTETWR